MQLSDFHNKHKGRLAFVIGSGPSIHFEKLDGLQDHLVFAVNSALPRFRFANYFVSDDEGIIDWDYFHKILPKFGGTSFLSESKFKSFIYGMQKHTVLYEGQSHYDPFTKALNNEALRITDDSSKPVVAARSSCGAAVHIAHLMGCSPIVLLGNDCCYAAGDKAHFWQFPGEHKPQRVRGYTLPGRKTMIRGKSLDDDHREIMDYWTTFGQVNPHLNIINASTNGVLDCFPKMPLVDIMARYVGVKATA
jgi:hypothetical protein